MLFVLMFGQYLSQRRERQGSSEEDSFGDEDEPPPDSRHYKIIFQLGRPHSSDFERAVFISEREVLSDGVHLLKYDSGLSGKLDSHALGITSHSLTGKDSRDEE